MNSHTITITITASNESTVLYRVVGMLQRKHLSIMHLVFTTTTPGQIEITINVEAEKNDVAKMIRQIERIIEVASVNLKNS